MTELPTVKDKERMSGYLESLQRYKSIKEISDLADEVMKLREYYHARQYLEMRQYIRHLSDKYPIDTLQWNSLHPIKPFTDQQAYTNAESFMKQKSISVLKKYGVVFQERRSDEE